MCGICGFCDFTRDNAGPVWREAGERMGEPLAPGGTLRGQIPLVPHFYMEAI